MGILAAREIQQNSFFQPVLAERVAVDLRLLKSRTTYEKTKSPYNKHTIPTYPLTYNLLPKNQTHEKFHISLPSFFSFKCFFSK